MEISLGDIVRLRKKHPLRQLRVGGSEIGR